MNTTTNNTDEPGTTLVARNFPRKADTHTMTTQTAVNNDYVVLEFGTRNNQTTSTAYSMDLRLGDTMATALDRDDAETTDNHAWCDFLSGLAAPTAGATTAPGWSNWW